MSGASMNGIKARIKSVQSTMQITKAMELVATSKLRRAKERAEGVRPYQTTLEETLVNILSAAGGVMSPYTLPYAEGIDRLTLKPSLSRAAVDGGCRPVVGRHIQKGSRPGGNGKRPAQHRAQAQAGGQFFQNRSFHLSASL